MLNEVQVVTGARTHVAEARLSEFIKQSDLVHITTDQFSVILPFSLTAITEFYSSIEGNSDVIVVGTVSD